MTSPTLEGGRTTVFVRSSRRFTPDPATSAAACLLVASLVSAGATAAGAQQAVTRGHPVPLEVGPRGEAVLLHVGSQAALVYELLIANPTDRALVLVSVEALDGAGGSLATWRGASLATAIGKLPPLGGDSGPPTVIGPGERVLLYGWIDSTNVDAPPHHIGHRLLLEDADAATAWTLDVERIPVRLDALVLDAPVRGGRWLVSNGYANDSDHRRFLTVSGGLLIPQRFGADYLKLGDDGNNAGPERPLRNEAFHSFDEPVYAVADGTVVSVHAGLADNAAGSSPGALEWADIPGNHVILRLADGVFALYAHLRQGSIAVSEGQTLRRGDLVGRIGNSGNTSAPHLHFHVHRGPDPNLSDGVPFRFRSFEVLAEAYTFLPTQLPFPGTGRREDFTAPRKGWVIRFPQG